VSLAWVASMLILLDRLESQMCIAPIRFARRGGGVLNKHGAGGVGRKPSEPVTLPLPI